MQNSTWIDRITDESNLWFNATESDDQEDFVSAVSYYLEDASDCLRQNLLLKAALSSACAADCLTKFGDHRLAKLLYSETASIYVENSQSVIDYSVRESLWSLREAYEHFLLADERDKAQEVYNYFSTLAKRVDPFFGDEEVAELPQIERFLRNPKSRHGSGNVETPPGILQSVEDFVQLRRSRASGARIPNSTGTKRTNGRQHRSVQIDEKSIIDQLG